MYQEIVLFLGVMCTLIFSSEDRKTVRLRAHITFQDPISDVYPCTTRNYEKTTCVSLFSCPGLMKALGTLERQSVQYVHKSICPIGGAGELYVCCGNSNRMVAETETVTVPTPTVAAPITHKPAVPTKTTHPKPTQTTQTDKYAHRDMVKKKLLPDRSYCGFQHTDDRFYNNSQTALDEFPWLVHIKITDHEYEYEYGDRCSGVIISARYVLTDAYCAYHATKVIVGEHKTDTNVSCVVESTLPECSEPAYEVRVEDKIRDGKRENGPYDFALLRLKENIVFSDFARPLCLPFVESERPKKTEALVFSGWGSQGPASAIKKRLVYDQTTDQECYDAEIGLDGNVKFANVTLLCVKPKATNTDRGCNGDHGGALMYSRKLQWFAEATVIKVYPENFTCTDNLPASSIKITSKTLDWILDSIKP